MKGIKRHIFICLIAIFILNTYCIYCRWLIPNNQADSLIQGLSFNGFWTITNLTLLVICGLTLKYKAFNDYLIKNNWSSGWRFLIEIVLMGSVFPIVYGSILLCYQSVVLQVATEQAMVMVWKTLSDKYFIALMLFHALTSVLLYFVFNLQRRSRSLENFLSQSMGNILKPKLVKRGFMFIDLDDATSLGEKLGSRKYARLLRDCFRLLNELVVFEGFEVYQYVGDEVVLSWDSNLPRAEVKAIQLFVDFKAYLLENVNHFIESYDTVPFFKCAIHSGEVVKSEIGHKTKHLVYHGDVLNTTSRMLGECHRLGTDIIISKETLRNVEAVEDSFCLELLWNVAFKGKSSTLDAYIISPKEVGNPSRFSKLWKPFFFDRTMIRDHQLN